MKTHTVSSCTLKKMVTAFALTLMLGACGNSSEPALSALPKLSLNEELQGLYQRSCANCHELAATGAPLTGQLEQWQIVFNKPFDLIMERAINGYAGMPPLGQCFECSAEQLETLVHYMSRPAEVPQR